MLQCLPLLCAAGSPERLAHDLFEAASCGLYSCSDSHISVCINSRPTLCCPLLSAVFPHAVLA